MPPLAPAAAPRVLAARRAIDAFAQRFGPAHLALACHAAVPTSLTPDLLYRIWVNFGVRLGVPWVAVADLLLSPLYNEVGHELYEADAAVRNELLERLHADPRFGPAAAGRVARFLLAYAEQLQRGGGAPAFASAQRWTAQLLLEPARALQEIGARIDPRTESDIHERGRLRALIRVSLDQLRGYPELYEQARRLSNAPLVAEPEPPAEQAAVGPEQQPAPAGGAPDLALSRWAVVVGAAEDAAVLQAIWPLVEHRMAQMGLAPLSVSWVAGETCAAWLERYGAGPPVLLYQPGEQTRAWLFRHGVSEGSRNPRRLPHYLLLLGRPGAPSPEDSAVIPFELQYDLALSNAVGRVCFSDEQGRHVLSGYRAYAEQLLAYERGPAFTRRHLVVFAPKHEEDTATMRTVDVVVRPIAGQEGVAARAGYSQELLIEQDATKANLERALRGQGPGGPAGVLWATGHGIGLPLSDQRLLGHQGALVCQDWSGFGSIKREQWFAAEDLPAQAALAGTVAVLAISSYTAGTPATDAFIFDSNKGRPNIAPFAFIAQLPQAMLRAGALGVIGVVERGWTSTFGGVPNHRGDPSAFGELLALTMAGTPLGQTLEPLVRQQRAFSIELDAELEAVRQGSAPDQSQISRLWMAWMHARCYILIGDPAARPRLEEQTA